MRTAHQVIQRDILSPSLTRIPYRRGSRDYTPGEHLHLVNGHIAKHLKSIEIMHKNTGIKVRTERMGAAASTLEPADRLTTLAKAAR